MIKKIIFVAIVSILYLPPATYAEKSWIENLSVDAKIDYVQKYMCRGFDLQNGDPAIQPSFTLDMGSTGFYSGMWASYALDAEWHEWNEIDFYVGYYDSLWEKDWYAIDIDITYIYYYFPRQDRDEDSHDIALALKLLNVIPPIGPSNLGAAFLRHRLITISVVIIFLISRQSYLITLRWPPLEEDCGSFVGGTSPSA